MTQNGKPSAKRVLVIDDSTVARANAVDLLTTAGYEVFSLPSAIGATRVILRNRIEVALVDLTMPGLSGDKLIRLLRQNPRLRDLIIVVVSSESTEQLRRIERETETDAVLSKTDVNRHLLALLRRLLITSSRASSPELPDSEPLTEPAAPRLDVAR